MSIDKKRWLLVQWVAAAMSLAFVACSASAQTVVNHPFNTGSPQTYTLGSANPSYAYYDNGGSAGNYSNSAVAANSVVTFQAPVGQRVRVRFSAFSTEAAWADRLYVYDGASTAASLIPSSAASTGIVSCAAFGWEGTTAPNNAGANLLISTGNALTFTFCSDSSVALSGWAAVVDIFGYPVGGTASGIASPGLVLALNTLQGQQTVAVNANGAFTFPTDVWPGVSYSIAVQSTPPGLTCILRNANGTVTDQPVTNVSVSCSSSAAVPTLSQWGLLLLSVLIGGLGLLLARRAIR